MDSADACGFGLHSILIIELDQGDDLLASWTYPLVEKETCNVVLSRIGLQNLVSDWTSNKNDPTEQTLFSKHRDLWHYVYERVVIPSEEEKPPVLKGFAVCLFSKMFDPERFGALAGVLGEIFSNGFDPRRVLEGFLAIFMTGRLNVGSATFQSSEFDSRRALLVTSVRDLTRLLDAKIILVWTALLLKRRVFVFCSRLPVLLRVIRGFPVLMWHRQAWDALRPLVSFPISPSELNDLQTSHVQVAGFLDPAVRSQESLYDLYVDLDAEDTFVAEHAKEDFVMHKEIHKEIATYLVQAAASDVNPAEIVKYLVGKTQGLISNLQRICQQEESGAYIISMDRLRKALLPPGMDRFLFNLGAAENFKVV